MCIRDSFSGLQVAVVMGGMSQQKQERILSHRPAVVVGTPGRMWELMSNEEPHLSQLDKLCCLVLDEADRLVETGHFVGVSNIIEYIANREARAKSAAPVLDPESPPARIKIAKVQKFLFSATMTLEKKGKGFKARKVSGVQDSTLQQLIKRLDLIQDPIFIDYSGQSKGQADSSQLHEYMLQCTNEDKELNLYNFLFSHPGRTLVFVNAVSMVRRIASILQNLQLPVYPLHADMQQRQRLKNMDRFSSEKHIILIATDVAARGIDVQDVDYVVQFHVPFNAETYVHRTGRTARATAEGTSLVMVSGNEQTQYRTIMHTLGKGAAGLPSIPLDARRLPALKTRLRLAKQLDKQEHGNKKKKVEKTWLQKSAEALDIILDDDGNASDEEFEAKQDKVKEGNLRRELDALLHHDI
eukprot:TRINITY_DN18824_c0_g1_i2.p1 TRINITY_DN18824_c0_g1~~TRINITY_DN18824_c0_g1_i2.p1  ORF type:complete len:413 (+),score=152.70 TRINITY_DN18824_c0_g1_i2:92-1330(+)